MSLLRRNYLFRYVGVPAVLLLLSLQNAGSQDNSAIAKSAQDSSTVATAAEAALPMPVEASQSIDWRNEIGTFKIGLVRGWSSDMSRPALLRVENTFSKALGTSVKVVVFERFTSLMDAQADGRVDLAAYSARAFSTLRLMCECVDAIATPGTLAGDTGQIAILAGDSTKIQSLSAIGSAKIGRVVTAGVATEDMLRGTLMIDNKFVAGSEKFWANFESYSAAIKAYQDNQIDAFVLPAAASFENLAGAGTEELQQITSGGSGAVTRPVAALWRSSFWPYGPVAVRSNLASEAKTILLRTLEQMDVSEPLVHATLSEALPGPFRKTNINGFANISAAIRQLVSQNANWR